MTNHIPKPMHFLAHNIANVMSNARRVLGEDKPQQAASTVLEVLIISDDNELRLFEGIMRDSLIGIWSSANEVVRHINKKDLHNADLRGDTRVAVVISKKLWDHDFQGQHAMLAYSLLTVSKAVGIPVHELVHFI